MKKIIIIIVILIFVILGLDDSLQIVNYKIDHDNIQSNVRIALLTDFHSNSNKNEIIEMLKDQDVDLILLGGDIIDDELEFKQGYDFISDLVSLYPCYYVSGNHEYWSGQYDQIREKLLIMGVNVLEGECKEVLVNGQTLNICGIDDFENEDAFEQLDQCKSSLGENYNILLAHRPEKIRLYSGFDLVLSGHAHGGQWRIPYLVNGLYSPNQGVLPNYAGGLYELNSQNFIVSRGLSNESTKIFRFYNHREIVVIDLI